MIFNIISFVFIILIPVISSFALKKRKKVFLALFFWGISLGFVAALSLEHLLWGIFFLLYFIIFVVTIFKEKKKVLNLPVTAVGFFCGVLIFLLTLEADLSLKQHSNFSLEEANKQYEFEFPIDSKREAVAYARFIGVWKNVNFKELEEKGYKDFVVGVRKPAQNLWTVVFTTDQPISIYKCSKTFDKMGEINHIDTIPCGFYK